MQSERCGVPPATDMALLVKGTAQLSEPAEPLIPGACKTGRLEETMASHFLATLWVFKPI